MTRDTHEHLIELHRRLVDESLTERVFGESLEADPGEPYRRHSKGLHGVRAGWALELDKLRCEKQSGKHRQGVVLPGQF